MRCQPRIGRAALLSLCLWSWGCRAYQPIAPADVPAGTDVLVTYQAVRAWLVPGTKGQDPQVVRSKLLVARLIRVAGDTVVVAPLRLDDQRGRIVAFPAGAPSISLTPADGAHISMARYSTRRTVGAVVVTAAVVGLMLLASACIMCGFGEGGSTP